jgi:hypothetical protein
MMHTSTRIEKISMKEERRAAETRRDIVDDRFDYDDFSLNASGVGKNWVNASKRRDGDNHNGNMYSSKHLRIREQRGNSKR